MRIAPAITLVLTSKPLWSNGLVAGRFRPEW